MNSNESDKILLKEDCERERTPQQLGEWVEEKMRLFYKLSKQSGEIKRKVILREDLFKEFHEEIYPLSLFAQYYYKGRADIFFKPEIGNKNFDVLILNRSKKVIRRIEITQAHGGHNEQLRMEYFVKHGHVSLLGKVTYEGTKRTGRRINVKSEAMDHSKVVENGLTLIDKALQKKSNKPEKHYDIGTFLLLVFDDYIAFRSSKDKSRLDEFIRKKIQSLNLDFQEIFLIGWSGNSFYKFTTSS